MLYKHKETKQWFITNLGEIKLMFTRNKKVNKCIFLKEVHFKNSTFFSIFKVKVNFYLNKILENVAKCDK